jgi:hypothetical protein
VPWGKFDGHSCRDCAALYLPRTTLTSHSPPGLRSIHALGL